MELLCSWILLSWGLWFLLRARWWGNRHWNIVLHFIDSGRVLLSDLRGQGTLVFSEVQLMHDHVGAVGVL